MSGCAEFWTAFSCASRLIDPCSQPLQWQAPETLAAFFSSSRNEPGKGRRNKLLAMARRASCGNKVQPA
jgi:hypothetical protein